MNTPGVDYHQRSLLKSAGYVRLASASLRRSALVRSGAAPLQSGRADARGRRLTFQPTELRSENTITSATISAAAGRVTARALMPAMGGLLAAFFWGSSALSAELPTKPVLTLDAARRVIVSAEATARQNRWPGVIAVVDAGGYLLALERMDGSPMLASTELAPAKARTAALFGKPTKALEDAIHNGRMAATTAGFVEMAGGVPLIVGGEAVGAIGVSTAQPDWDVAVAAAGAAALDEKPQP
jgi:glc operon protein GlcG